MSSPGLQILWDSTPQSDTLLKAFSNAKFNTEVTVAPTPVFVPMANHKQVFLFDVDNTLMDHDKVTADLRKHLHQEVGAERAQRYWELFEQIRSELGYADYLGALQRYRLEHKRDPHLLPVSYFLLSY